MATPSSGQICWSDIQAVAGGGYCMSDFNSASGRGYCASDYYNYSSNVNVYINVVVPSSLVCYSYGYFCAKAYDVNSNPINVDTTIYVLIDWHGDLGGTLGAQVVISSGTNCGSSFTYTAGNINCYGENYSYAGAYVPTTSGTQTYYINAINTSNYDYCPC